MTNFNNPIPVSPDALTDVLSFSAFAGNDNTDEISEKTDSLFPEIVDKSEDKVKEEESEEVENSEQTEDSEEDKETKDDKGLELDLEQKDKKDNEPPISEIGNIIDSLAEQGLIVEPYEGFDQDEVNVETLGKLLAHNFERLQEDSIVEYLSPLSEETKRLIEFDFNAKGKGVKEYLSTLIEEQNIKNLSIDNEYDQEKIVRQWYSRKEGYTQAEMEEKITELKDAGLLEKESKRLKPKLDDEAANIAKEKEEEQRQLRETETKVREVYNKRVIDTLKGGKIGGISLSKEEAGNLYSVLTGDETIEMTLPNNQKAMMSPLEAHIFFNKYAKEGSLERLALATLLLTNPAKFEKEYSKKIETKVANTFMKEHKYNNSVKSGGEDTRENKKKSFTQENNAKWPNILDKERR